MLLKRKSSKLTSWLVQVFNNREQAIAKGMTIGKVHFEVHKYYPPLAYGRISHEELAEGISLVKGKSKKGEVQFLLITYLLPIVSARAIPQQVEFFNEHIGELD